MSDYVYRTCCVNSTAKRINKMVDQSKEVTFKTLRKHVGTENLADVFPDYDWGYERGGLRMKDDWHVTYHRSKYMGKPCYYVVHSCIEYVFTKE